MRASAQRARRERRRAERRGRNQDSCARNAAIGRQDLGQYRAAIRRGKPGPAVESEPVRDLECLSAGAEVAVAGTAPCRGSTGRDDLPGHSRARATASVPGAYPAQPRIVVRAGPERAAQGHPQASRGLLTRAEHAPLTATPGPAHSGHEAAIPCYPKRTFGGAQIKQTV